MPVGDDVEMAVVAEGATATAVADAVDGVRAWAEPDPDRAAEVATTVDCLAIATRLPDAAGPECLLSVRETAPDLPVVLFGPDVDEDRAGDGGRTEYVAADDPDAVAAGIEAVLSRWREGEVVKLADADEVDVEDLLAESDGVGEDAFDRVPEPAVEYEFDDDTPRVVSVNTAFANAFGVRADAVVGDPLDEVVFDIGGGDHAALLEGESVEAELRCRTVEGVRTFLLRTTSPEDGPGVAVYTDISDYKSVEERYSALVQSSSDALFILDRRGIVDYVSPAVEEAFGHDPEALEGYPLTEYVHPEDRESVGELLSDPTGWAGETRSVTYRFRAEDGWRTVESAARSRLYDPAVEGVVMNCRDVTERERYQRELERQNDRLEEFASVVSHDLRNPLAVARGHLQNAQDGLAGEEAGPTPETALDEVETSMDRMETLIEELLALARRGEDVEEPEPVSLAAVWDRAVSNVDTADLTTVAEDDAVVLADEARLRRAFENLLRNAVEHATGGDDGATEVRVGLVDPDEDGDVGDPTVSADGLGPEVEVGVHGGVYVEDDGPGIPSEEHDRVLDHGYTTSAEGTGLGLNIVRRIAEAHGWSVSVADGRDGGARVEVHDVELLDGAG